MQGLWFRVQGSPPPSPPTLEAAVEKVLPAPPRTGSPMASSRWCRIRLSLSVYSRCCLRTCSAMVGVPHRPLLTTHTRGLQPPCEDRVLDGPASGGKGSKGGPCKYCDPRRAHNITDWKQCHGSHAPSPPPSLEAAVDPPPPLFAGNRKSGGELAAESAERAEHWQHDRPTGSAPFFVTCPLRIFPPALSGPRAKTRDNLS